MTWCNDDPNTFCNIGERDVDFLLLEELRCSDSFRRWFLRGAFQALKVSGFPDAGNVFHSVHRTGLSSGETDLLVEFPATSPSGSGTHSILIEDKIDAEFSDRTKCGSPQTKRYRAEIEKKIAAGEWVAGVTLLVAPQGYVQGVDASAFDASVSYEDIAAWFAMRIPKSEPTLALRFEHRRQMMQAALARWRRGWNRQIDETVSGLWGHYHKIASSEYPDVCMKYKGGEPPDSYTVSFACLPPVQGLRKCRIDHVMERGTVDILIPGAAGMYAVLSAQITPVLAQRMMLRKAGKSLGINLKVSPIRRFEAVEAQLPAVHEALKAVRLLKAWFETHGNRLSV